MLLRPAPRRPAEAPQQVWRQAGAQGLPRVVAASAVGGLWAVAPLLLFITGSFVGGLLSECGSWRIVDPLTFRKSM